MPVVYFPTFNCFPLWSTVHLHMTGNHCWNCPSIYIHAYSGLVWTVCIVYTETEICCAFTHISIPLICVQLRSPPTRSRPSYNIIMLQVTTKTAGLFLILRILIIAIGEFGLKSVLSIALACLKLATPIDQPTIDCTRKRARRSPHA